MATVLEIKKPVMHSYVFKEIDAEASAPTSFCPLTDTGCRRLECQLWVSDGDSHGCALFFMGALAQKQLQEDYP